MGRVDDIAKRLGEAHAATLARVAGGTRLNVPPGITPPPTGGKNGFERLEAMLGYDLAVLVVFHFGNSRLYVPRAERSKPIDPRTVARMTRRGLSASSIARKLHCSDRTVFAKRREALSLGMVLYPENGARK